jgi:hypothetical protein
MSEFNENDFLKELSEVCKKYELKNCIFAGTTNDNKMIGLFCIETFGRGHSFLDSVLSFSNAARMYQSAREHMLKLFDKM